MRLTWVQPEDLLPHQLVQSAAEGVDVTDVADRWQSAGGTTTAPVSGASDKPAPPELRALARELLEELDTHFAGWVPPEIPQLPLLGAAKDGRVLNAWLGRAAGNLLGKPVEKIPREGIREILQSSGQWPLAQYVTAAGVPEEVLGRWPWNRRSKPTSLREVIDGMPEDDDLNFAILALQLVERHGGELTTEDVAAAWLSDLPAGRVFTAERVAYRNLLDGVDPLRAALVRNPFREWIGAQIRTDVYGWVNPGDRSAAARLALADARLSHTGAGMDGAIWVAAMSAAAMVLDDPIAVAEAGLEAISVDSEIARAVCFGLDLAEAPLDDALDALHARYGHLHWVHSVNNSALTAYALTAPDFATGIGRAVMGGWDTDSAGATVGAVLGAVLGVPAEWAGPLDDRLATSLPGMGQVAISELAARTVAAQRKVEARRG
ncbi:ADP-ribosylglycohydrolase family protein [Streptomyces sp. SID13031]|uniref:ADP-ribosylglycohydrolase family protein n=1 Tax=Streptomyces sp. SID13031 TaxID=2706046 RepID=UPI0013C61BFF|nr:ADP-ribosylglycohydrolase family protein [Streptomyces sp. SID13031]NEA30195.1 ADP-ribosylglycohydrolase family protein [Streptomyces sp. SID13031]